MRPRRPPRPPRPSPALFPPPREPALRLPHLAAGRFSVGLLLFFSAHLYRRERPWPSPPTATRWRAARRDPAPHLLPLPAGVDQRLTASGGDFSSRPPPSTPSTTAPSRAHLPIVSLTFALVSAHLGGASSSSPNTFSSPVHLHSSGPKHTGPSISPSHWCAAHLSLSQLRARLPVASDASRPSHSSASSFARRALGYASTWINTFLLTHHRVLPMRNVHRAQLPLRARPRRAAPAGPPAAPAPSNGCCSARNRGVPLFELPLQHPPPHGPSGPWAPPADPS